MGAYCVECGRYYTFEEWDSLPDITTFCFRCKKDEEVISMVINNDGVTMTLACGYTMRKVLDA